MNSVLFPEVHKEIMNLWWEVSCNSKKKRQLINRASNDRLIQKYINEVMDLVPDIKAINLTEEQKQEISIKTTVLFMDSMNMNPEHIEILSNKLNGYEVLVDFIRRASEFDPQMEKEDILQALRNVWVLNIMQMYLGQKVQLTDAAFGYSMLYPLTDNYLDNEKITLNDKKTFNRWLEKRLKGETYIAFNKHQKKVSAMIKLIENDFPRNNYPVVYISLLAIFDAQRRSMKQQHISNIFDIPVLDLTFYKGGSSVLADAFLCKGCLNEEEMRMAYGYGVILQMADDLQDVLKDIKKEHNTMMNIQARYGSLDELVCKYKAFIEEYLNIFFVEDSLERSALKELVANGMKIIIDNGIVHTKQYFTKEEYQNLEEDMIYSPEVMIKLEKKLSRKLKKTPRLTLASSKKISFIRKPLLSGVFASLGIKK